MTDFLHLFWDPDPIMLSAGPLRVAWYGVMWAVSFMLGYYLMRYIFAREKAPAKWLDPLVLYMVLGSVLGARLGHCFFYEPDYYLSNPLEIIMIQKGGMASHGGAIGIILVLAIWSRRVSKLSMLWILDRIVIAVAIAGVLIRFGNFINQEIVGSESNASYAFVFPRNDQGSTYEARPEDKGIEVKLKAEEFRSTLPDLFRSYDGVGYERVAGEWTGATLDGDRAVKRLDATVKDTCCVNYAFLYTDPKGEKMVAPQDTNDTRRITLRQSVASRTAKFDGRWVGDSLELLFSWGDPNMEQASFSVQLMESADGINWTKLKGADLDGAVQSASLQAKVAPPAGSTMTYLVAYKAKADLNYIARHPAQLYEAFCYLLILGFLLWLYFKQDGKIPLGQHFGWFLILIFTARFFIEYFKAWQVDFLGDSPINMGQILSIPFVMAGVFFLVRSRSQPREFQHPEEPE